MDASKTQRQRLGNATVFKTSRIVVMPDGYPGWSVRIQLCPWTLQLKRGIHPTAGTLRFLLLQAEPLSKMRRLNEFSKVLRGSQDS